MLATLTATASTAQTAELDRDRYEARASADQTRSSVRRYVDRRREYRERRAAEYRNGYPPAQPPVRGGYVAAERPAPSRRYTSVTVGQRMGSAYYAPRYYVDEQRYGLAPVSGSIRWIRYGTDAVRIDTGTGRVISMRRRYFR